MKINNIYHGDNLFWMPDMPSESIDLIYIDPPFGTQSLWQSKAFREKVQDFKFYDIWGKGINGYIEFLTERLRHMHRLLKPTGSLFVHLDWRMSHYIKIELDKIFGVKNPASNNTNFINEIIWLYKTGGAGKKSFAKKHDAILFYCKNPKKHKFYPQKEKSYLSHKYGFKNTEILQDKNGYYTNVLCRDVWDLPALRGNMPEVTGWPTQKPLALLDRIIKATTKEGDLVADFFCGCGTAIVSAKRLNRKWIGMDASKTACEVMLDRLKNDDIFVDIQSKPLTAGDFAKLNPLEFEKSAVRAIGGVTNHAQVADGGIDGRLAFDGTPIQVKKHDKPVGNDDRFKGFYYPLSEHGRGIYISWKGYTNPAKEMASKWRRKGLDIQLLTIQDILNNKFREQPLRKVA